MEFKVGDKVKFRKEVFEKMARYDSNFKKMRNVGVVIKEGSPYINVDFSPHPASIWWIKRSSLELIIKNQQLLFSFME